MPVAMIIHPQETSVGGVPVRRVLPARERQMVGPFLLMDQAGPLALARGSGQGGVPEHPHAGLSTFTYLIEGSVHHRDSAGHDVIVRSGDIALMTAGSGISHEELADPADTSDVVRIFMAQMWLALPDHLEEMDPTFEHHTRADLPEVLLDGARVRLGMGSFAGAVAPTTCHVPTVFAEIHLGAGASLPVPPDLDEQALFVFEGDVSIDGAALEPHRLALLTEEQATLHSAEGAHLLLFGGDRFPNPRYIGGSFVASSPDKVRRWMHDSALGRWPRVAR